ncbi:MAG TPA: GAF domain-containing sensor histidine kinase [Actinomycetota bacterium]|nr:GAF domain-containing sensor histidine kinase [Actinomycetota bacterium]
MKIAEDPRATSPEKHDNEPGDQIPQKHLEVLARVGKSLLSAEGLENQLSLTLTLATEALGADRGSIMLLGEDKLTLSIESSVGLPPGAPEATQVGSGIAGWVAEKKEPLILHGEVHDPRFEGVDPNIGSAISLPLESMGSVVGVLNLVRSKGELFTSAHVQLASSLADMASVAIEKAKLHASLQDRERRVSDLLAAAIGAQERERTRIAADIHDGFLQDLSAVYLKAENARTYLAREEYDRVQEELAECQQFLKEQVERVRQYIFEVRPPSLDEVGIGPTIAEMVQRCARDIGIKGTFEDQTSGVRLSKPLETILYRTAQEALRNIAKHSKASSFNVSLTQESSRAILEIRDDGKGFDLSTSDKKRHHYGIETMRERLELSGGSLGLYASPGGGTVVRAEIPLEAA